MNDKLIFFLMLVMLVCGVYTYDQYQIGQGKPSPVGEFIDYAGLSKHLDVLKKKKTVETKTEYFRFNSKGELEQLLEAQRALREKRNELLAKRKEILEKIYALNGSTQRETESYVQLLNKEKNRILKVLPEIKMYGKGLSSAYEQQDEASKERYLNAIKDGMMSVFQEVTNNPEENIPYVLKTIEGLDRVVHDEADAVKNYCGDVQSENLEQKEVVARCIKKRVMDLQGDVNMYSQVVKGPLDGFLKVKELTETLDYETQLLKNNSDATEARIGQEAEEIEDGLRYLVQELVEITDQEMQSFLKIYSAYQKEQEALLNNLASNQRRFISSQKMNHQKIKILFESLNNSSRFDFSGILAKYNDWEKERLLLMEQFTEDERDLFISTTNRRKGNRVYINNLIKMYESMKEHGINPQEGSDSVPSILEKTSATSMEDSKSMASELMQKRKQERQEQQYQNQRTAQDMDRLRDKARNDGFYD